MLAIVVPFVTIVDRPDVRLDDDHRRLQPRAAARHRNSSLYRVVSFFPYVVPAIAIGLIWSKIYDPSSGLLNGVLTKLGLERVRGLRLARRDAAPPGWA